MEGTGVHFGPHQGGENIELFAPIFSENLESCSVIRKESEVRIEVVFILFIA